MSARDDYPDLAELERTTDDPAVRAQLTFIQDELDRLRDVKTLALRAGIVEATGQHPPGNLTTR